MLNSCSLSLSEDVDLELRLARFEQLIARRPLLLNSVLLRQNPHNVHEWHKRVKLYEGKPRQVAETRSGHVVGALIQDRPFKIILNMII